MWSPQQRLKNPALVVVDMQNDFCRVGAALEVPDARATIGAHQRLLEVFRRKQLPVVYTKFLTFQQPVLLWEWSPQALPDTKCCWKGHKRYYPDLGREVECTDVIEELAPQPGEPIIEKYCYGAFHGTPLAQTLQFLKVETLVVTGTVTQICVEETARQAFHHGYPTTMVSDAVSSFAPDLHAATLKNFASKFGWVMTSAEVIDGLG
jgi:nicotinamidase-related amidase